MELRIYNRNLELVGTIDSFRSLLWNRKYYESGDFELYLPLTLDNLELAKSEYLVSIVDKTKRRYKEAGVIEDVNITDTSDKKEIIVKGRFITSYLDRRLIKETFSFSGKSEVAMQSIIEQCTSIPNLEIGQLNGFDEEINFQATMKNLLSTEQKIAKSSGFGFYIEPDFRSKKLTFKVYKGVNRALSQVENSRVVFSDEYNNLTESIYQFNNQLYKTVAIVGGEGEGTDRVYVEVGSGEGLGLREIFVDAKDLHSNNMTSDEYKDVLRQRGYEKLESNLMVESFDFSILPNSSFEYINDYDLGDIVSIRKTSWGISQDKRITAIQEIYEGGSFTISLTLGNPFKEMVDWSN